ncbi:metallophosphoesterase [Vallitalea okinawensis]|uniref:metallophosphoesterase n=1 Tax=Vallitalea okinawensis TaxID=2078660 RepID=UPI0013007167|nr:metallophosphoesterase [Vallitalea okinawensis]
MTKRGNKKVILGIIILFLLAISIFLYTSNNWIENTRYIISSPKIEDPITVVHLSDLHGKQFGENNSRLMKNIVKENPDIIVFTGDLIDAVRNENIEESVEFLQQVSQFAPIYYIRGNHEFNSSRYQEIMNKLNEVKGELYILDGDYINITLKEQKISILGLDRDKEGVMEKFLSEDGYKIILDHYSENFLENANLSQLDCDLVLTGHAHGGQWRLPIIGGVYSPGQGINPKYYQGMFEANGSTQIISRGLGNSIFPLRLFNRPEVITIVIE